MHLIGIIPSKGARCKFFYDRILDAFVKLNGTNVEKKFTHIDFTTWYLAKNTQSRPMTSLYYKQF